MTEAKTSHNFEAVECPNCGANATAQWGEVHADGELIKKWLIRMDCSEACWESDPDGAQKAADEFDRKHRIG